MVVPAGLIMWSPADADFGQFLLCDGRSLSSSDYRDLYLICSFKFGGAAESFNIPDIRNRFIGMPGDEYWSGDFVGETMAGNEVSMSNADIGLVIRTQDKPSIGISRRDFPITYSTQYANYVNPSFKFCPPAIALNAFISGSREDLVRARALQMV